MSNPLVDFVDLVDQYGTQVNSFTVQFAGGMSSAIWRWGTELIVLFVQMALTYAIWMLDLVINQGLFLDIARSVYQVLLDTVYQYVNPLIVGTVAFMILMARIFVGDKVLSDEKTGRITGYELNYATFADESFAKKVGNQLANTGILMFIIIVAMANPFALLTKIFSFINWVVASLAPNSVGASPQVDGVLVPMLQLINYQNVLAPACNESWSRTTAAGGNLAKLACLTSDEEAATTASPVTLVLAIMSVVMIAGFVCFSWVILMRFTWMLYRMIVNIAIVPWQAALLIANPGSERKKLDSIKDRFLDAGKSLFWLLVTVTVAAAVPAALLNGLALAKLPAFVTMLMSSVLFFIAGRVANSHIGRKWKREKDGTRVEILDGTTGWNDFRVNGGMGKWLAQPFNDAQKASAAELAMSAEIIDGTRETMGSQGSAQKGVKVDNSAVEDPGMDEAVRTVELVSTQPTVTVALAADKDRSSADAETTGYPVTADESGSSAREFAAAAAAALVAEADAGNAMSAGSGVAGGLVDPATSPGKAESAATAATVGAGVMTALTADGGSRHHRDDEETSPGQADAVTTADEKVDAAENPVAARRQMIESYIGAVEQITVDPDVIDEEPVAASTAQAAESTAFRRIAKVYDESVADGDVSPTTSGVTGGFGEFLSVTRRLVEWNEYKTLAKSLGMNIGPVPDELSEKKPNITFYSSSEDGKNDVRYRGRDGFGDAI